MPFLRVTFIDGCKAENFMNQDARREAIVLAKRLELLHADPITGDIPVLNARVTEPVSQTLLPKCLPEVFCNKN